MKNAVKVVGDVMCGSPNPRDRMPPNRVLTLTIDNHRFVRVSWPVRGQLKSALADTWEYVDDVQPVKIRRMQLLSAEMMLRQVEAS